METDEERILRSSAPSGRLTALSRADLTPSSLSGDNASVHVESLSRDGFDLTKPGGEGVFEFTAANDLNNGGRMDVLKALWTPTGQTVLNDLSEALDCNFNDFSDC